MSVDELIEDVQQAIEELAEQIPEDPRDQADAMLEGFGITDGFDDFIADPNDFR